MGVVDNEGRDAHVGHKGCMESLCTVFSNLLWTWNGSTKNQVFENKIVVAERSGKHTPLYQVIINWLLLSVLLKVVH